MKAHRDDDSFYRIYCPLLCSCAQLPPEGTFTVGQEYLFAYIIDAVKILDDLGQVIVLAEKIFMSCFCNIAELETPVTCYDPMLYDETTYHLYFILQQDRSDLEAIRAFSKLKGVNYIQAKRILNDTRVLVAAGTAYDMRELLNRLAQFQVQYEISPPYPYPY